MVFVESLSLGFRALSWSAERAGEEDEEITRTQVIWTMVIAVIFALALFVAGTRAFGGFLKGYFDHSTSRS